MAERNAEAQTKLLSNKTHIKATQTKEVESTPPIQAPPYKEIIQQTPRSSRSGRQISYIQSIREKCPVFGYPNPAWGVSATGADRKAAAKQRVLKYD